MIHFLILSALLLQNPSLDSASPKERQAAAEQMAVLGNSAAIPQLAAALKKESKSDVRASMVAALGRIRDREAVSILADTLRNDLDKDVRLQAIDSLLRLYIPIEDSGQIRTIFNKVKSVFVSPDAPVIGPEVQVDAPTKEALAAAMQKDFSDEVRDEPYVTEGPGRIRPEAFDTTRHRDLLARHDVVKWLPSPNGKERMVTGDLDRPPGARGDFEAWLHAAIDPCGNRVRLDAAVGGEPVNRRDSAPNRFLDRHSPTSGGLINCGIGS